MNTATKQTLGTWKRTSDGTTDIVKAKSLKNGEIQVTHSWSFDGYPLGSRESIKSQERWLRQYDALRDSGFTRASA